MQCHAGNTPLRWRCRYSAASNSSIALNVSVSAASLFAPLRSHISRTADFAEFSEHPACRRCTRSVVVAALPYVVYVLDRSRRGSRILQGRVSNHLKGAPEVKRWTLLISFIFFLIFCRVTLLFCSPPACTREPGRNERVCHWIF